MPPVLTTSLTIGVVVSVVLTELAALSPGGVIVPGYVALILDRPAALAGLLVLATCTFFAVRLLSTVLMLYGSRRYGLTVLIGLALSVSAQALRIPIEPPVLEWVGLGHIIPGLLAHHFDRQGFWPTLVMLAIAAPIVRLVTVLVMG